MANRHIAVYADWDGLPGPMKIGALHARSGAGREVFEFEFDREVLTHPDVRAIQLDPRIAPFEGPQQGARDR